MIRDRKIVAMIVWNPFGIHLTEAFPKGRIFNAKLLFEASRRQLVIHADNNGRYTGHNRRTLCAENGLPIAAHLLYLRNLAPSYFFLFEHVKHYLQKIAFPSDEALHMGFRRIMVIVPHRFNTRWWRWCPTPSVA
jgi:hypothetical protein